MYVIDYKYADFTRIILLAALFKSLRFNLHKQAYCIALT